ncbi:MAG: hypothetical protein A2Y24_08035 [Clostridiales bacterium GWE2_32_10]|nr:MAG: hypothetical protein A2Y24_08035 [Clostridiales bacterium GWE2_32_10]HBY20938.1 hypothetical protein [Clostridiales bacterium]
MIKGTGNRGSITLMTIFALLTTVIVAVYLTSDNLLALKNSVFDQEKYKANSIAEHGVTLYIERLKKYFLDHEDKAGITTFELNNTYTGTNDTDIDLDIKFDADKSTKDTQYFFKTSDEDDIYESLFYRMNPPIEDNLIGIQALKNSTGITDSGQIAIAGAYNKNFEVLEYYILVNDNIDKKLKLYAYKPYIDTQKFDLKTEIDIKELYEMIDPALMVEVLNPEDYLMLEVIFDDSAETLNIYYGICKKNLKRLDLFSYNPYSLGISELIGTFENVEATKTVLSGIFSNSLETSEIFIGIFDETENKIAIYSYIPIVSEDKFDLTYQKEFEDTVITFDLDVLWGESMYATNIYLPVIFEADVNILKLYSILPYTQNIEKEISTMEFTLDKISQVSISIYDDIDKLQTMYAVIAVGDLESKKITYKIGYPELESWDKTREIQLGDNENVGRLDVEAITGQSLDEVILINPTPIYRRVTNNIITDKDIIAKTNFYKGIEDINSEAMLDLDLQYEEPENGGTREISKVHVNKLGIK